MKKPLGIKIVYGIIFFRLIFILLVLLIVILSSTIFSTNSFFLGFQNGLFDGAGIKHTNPIAARQYGEFFGYFTFWPIVLLGLSLIFLKKRNYKGIIIMFVLLALFSFKDFFGLVWSGILLIIIFCDKKTINYLKNSVKDTLSGA